MFINKITRKWLAGIALLMVAIIVLIGVYSLMGRNNLQREITEKFVVEHLMMQNGGVRTKFKDEEFIYDYPGGSDVLSESQGLFMRYAVSVRKKELFEKTLSFVENGLYTDGIISYRHNNGYGTFPTNAALDDLRIIRGLLEAADAFDEPKYQKLAWTYADRLYEKNVEDFVLYDFYELQYKYHNSFLTLCYADFKTMLLLSETDERWNQVVERARPIVENGYISDEFPLFATSYDYESGIYKTDHIETIQSLITAIHLAEMEICPERTVEYVKEKVKNRDLLGAYGSSGEPLNDIQSTAVYALASILGKTVGDNDLQSAALTQMKLLQINVKSDPLYGAFADAETQEAYSFDNLCALLAFTESR